MPIRNTELAVVKDLLKIDRAVPAIIVRGIVDRLEALERALCANCRARYVPAAP